MDSLKFHPGPPYRTLLRPAGGPPLKWPNGRFRGSPPVGRAACGHLLPLWTLHAVRLCAESHSISRRLAHNGLKWVQLETKCVQ
jgi:hypothetical protein